MGFSFDFNRLPTQICAPLKMDPLLTLLKRDAHTPPEDLARELSLSVAEVHARIAHFEQEGVILGYQAILNADKTGEDSVTAVIEVKITPERGGGFDRLAARIAQFDEVKSCYLMSGGYDLLVLAEGRTLQSIATFIAEKLSTIQGVISTATHFRLKVYKENGVLLHREKSEPRLAVTP
jgi:DNA-binding Lrp family transcriptional regulator